MSGGAGERGWGQSKTVWICVSPLGHMLGGCSVLIDRPQWLACHGVTSLVSAWAWVCMVWCVWCGVYGVVCMCMCVYVCVCGVHVCVC